jgi:hypothetical protein
MRENNFSGVKNKEWKAHNIAMLEISFNSHLISKSRLLCSWVDLGATSHVSCPLWRLIAASGFRLRRPKNSTTSPLPPPPTDLLRVQHTLVEACFRLQYGGQPHQHLKHRLHLPSRALLPEQLQPKPFPIAVTRDDSPHQNLPAPLMARKE